MRHSLVVFGLTFLTACSLRPTAVPTAGCGSGGVAITSELAFEEVDSGLPRVGQQRDGFDLADMNGDGHLDLVTGPVRKGRLAPAIYLGDGDGHFSRWREVTFPPLPYDYGEIRAGDLDGDGVPDLVLASHLRGIVAMINDGGLHFAPWSEGLRYVLPQRAEGDLPFSSRAIELADWDGDGRLDIVALNEGPALRASEAVKDPALAVWLNRGGWWQRLDQPTVHSFGSSLAVGDVDGDRRIDAVISSNVAGMHRILHLGRPDGWTLRDLDWLSSGGRVTAVAIVNRSIVAATQSIEDSAPCTTLQTATITANPKLLWSESTRAAVSEISAGDLDGDGEADLVAMQSDGVIRTFLSHGRRGYTRDATIAPPPDFAGCDGFDVHVRDLDGDGRGEILAAYASDVALGAHARCVSSGGLTVFRSRQ